VTGLQGRRIALVGGAGFIGTRLALRLVELGAFVEVVDSLQVNNLLHYISQPQLENRSLYLRILQERLDLLEASGVRVDVQDARDYDALSRTLDRLRPNVVVQLAAVAHANKSNKDPYSTFDHSLRTLENALDVARSIEVERFVFMSSSMVYGNFLTPEVSEDHPLDPIGIYGALKLSGEKIVTAYNQVFGLPYTVVRPSALYGPGCVSKRVVQLFIEHALAGAPLRIDGDGEEKLDFSWIEDVVEGICLAIASPRGANETFNVTAGNARSINDLVAAVRTHFPELEVEYVERDELRPFRGTLSVDKARELIGYDPGTSLEDGVARYVDWYRDLVSDGRVVVGSSLTS
jgi:nucleoside-diphosphate-sugar epimerase